MGAPKVRIPSATPVVSEPPIDAGELARRRRALELLRRGRKSFRINPIIPSPGVQIPVIPGSGINVSIPDLPSGTNP